MTISRNNASLPKLVPSSLKTLLLIGGLMAATSALGAEEPAKHSVDAAAVAKLPAPGTVVPGNVAFTPDGLSVTYLKSESASLSRVLWKAARTAGEPRVIARPPGEGDTEKTLSEAEKLRRERQRLRDTGITQVVRAEKADVAVIPLGGDLYILRGEGPLDRLTNTPSPEIDPRLSKDGTKVAFVRDDELRVIDLESRKETTLSKGAGEGISHALAEFIAQEEMDRSAGFWWSPDGEWLAYQETDERHIPLYSIVHQGGASLSTETHRYPFAGAPNAKVRLGVVPAKGGETLWLDLPAPGSDDYLARVVWDAPRSILVQTLSRDQKSLKLTRVEIPSLTTTLLIEDRAPTWVNLHNDLKVLSKTGEFLWSSERSGFRHLELRARDGKLIRELTHGEWPVDAVAALDEERREAWFTAGRESPLEAQLYRVGLDGGEVIRVTQEPGIHQATVSHDGNAFVDVVSTRNRPPVTTLRDRNGTILRTLDEAGSDPRVKELALVPPDLVEFQSRDGVRLFGAYHAPRSKALGEKVPLVVMVYGGPHVQRVTESWGLTADLTAQFLAERGFAVWKADNRGSSRRGHAFEAALNRRMGEVEVRDQVDGVAHLCKIRPEVDATRVGITGGSYGGYMTLRCLQLAPEVFKAGVSVAPVTDWDGYDTCYTERYMGTPADNPAGYRESSVLTHAENLKGALFLIHGMLDENVHFRHTARLTTALISAARPFELLPLPDERHSSRREPDRKYVAERIAEFFESRLKLPAPLP